jgi:hypothetical protein
MSRSPRPLYRRGLRALGLAVAVTAATAGPGAAVQTDRFGVEPYPLFVEGDARRSFEFPLGPGESVTDSVRVWNTAREVVSVRLYGAPVEVHDGQYEVAPFESRTSGAGSWVDLDREHLRLEPGEEAVVEFTVRAPAAAAAGDRTVALVAESDTGVTTGGVDVVARLALLATIERPSSFLQSISWWVWLALALIVMGTASAMAARRRARRSSAGPEPVPELG